MINLKKFTPRSTFSASEINNLQDFGTLEISDEEIINKCLTDIFSRIKASIFSQSKILLYTIPKRVPTETLVSSLEEKGFTITLNTYKDINYIIIDWKE